MPTLKIRLWIAPLILGFSLLLAFLNGCSAIAISHRASASVPVTEAKVIHLLERVTLGIRPGDMAHVRQVGIDRYLQEQLYPQVEPALPELATLETLNLSPGELLDRYGDPLRQRRQQGLAINREMQRQSSRQTSLPLQQAQQARLMRAIASPNQLQEVMVDFWYNHFNVGSDQRKARVLVGAYERQAIRPYVFGKFRELLGATAHHAAMQYYLDNWLNTDPNSPRARGAFSGINENYARELMELHTLGVDGGYSQQDVVSLAHILTGWGVCGPRETPTPTQFCFHPDRHDAQAQVFLGQTIASGGQEQGEKSLDILAQSPATAQHISYQLAQYFVADQPPARLVNHLAKIFQQTEGDIRAVLTALLNSSEFWDEQNYDQKFKTPYQYVISAIRASDRNVDDLMPIIRFLTGSGMPIYGCDSPPGYANTQAAWLSPDALLRRMSWVTALTRSHLNRSQPKGQPQTAINLDQITSTLGQLSPTTEAAIAASPPNLRPALLLSSPEFMHR
jgi:uncharacterized protein (DUF1800 family)